MSELIKCPICHEMAGIRYSENRVYQSRCQNIKCRETVTVTASSESAAEELFSKFEKGTNQPQLTIPKSIADELDQIYYEDIDEHQKNISKMICSMEPFFEPATFPEIFFWLENDETNINLIAAYLAGKALGVDLVKVVADD